MTLHPLLIMLLCLLSVVPFIGTSYALITKKWQDKKVLIWSSWGVSLLIGILILFFVKAK